MEKQRSFSWKSTRFLVLSLTISFSLVLLSILSFWAMKAPSLIHQQSYLLLNTPSISLSINPLNFQSLTGPFADSPASNVTNTDLIDTHFKKPQNSSGFVATSFQISVNTQVGIVADDGTKVDVRNGKYFTSFGTNFSVDTAKYSNLRDAQMRKPQNSSGFVISSSVKRDELERKGDGSIEVGNFTVFGAKEDDRDMSSYETRKQQSVLISNSFGKVRSPIVEKIEDKRVKGCVFSEGRWVFNESYPLYTNHSCSFIDEGFNCMGNGRLDKDFMKWRWQPQDCDIPRFNATTMLELIRGKRLVFAGDSINRNQWESLLCLLMGAVKDPRKVYEIHGRKITKEKGIYSFRFVDYQCTVEFYVSHFLVHESKARIGQKRKPTLRIDTIDRGSARWRGADILIFNTGNWWSHHKTKAGINYYQEGKQVHPHLDASTAYRKALATWATWVDKHIDPQKTRVFFRSTAPAHFRGGQWNTGGHCREARRPLNESYIDNIEKDLITAEVIKMMRTPVNFLNITALSSYRIDGHPSKYGRSPTKRASSVEDCSHWCLPGVPDTWNELIYYQLLLKQNKSVYVS